MSEPVIEARDLAKAYGPTVGLEGLDLTVARGEIFGFLGPNGSGKTTTIRLLLDLIRPTRGEVRVFGRSARDPAARARIGYLPGELELDERLTGREMLAIMAALHPGGGRQVATRRRDEVCERLGLDGRDLDRRIRDYSRGMKQKVGLIAALQEEPDLLVLDEPTTALDPLVRETIFELLREAGAAGRTVFHSSHVLSEVDRTCTRVAIVRRGRLMALEGVAELRRATPRRMVVRFGGEPPADAVDLPGIRLLGRDDRTLTLSVSGDLQPLLGVLAAHAVEDMVFPEPTLEDAFVRFYRDDGSDARTS